MAPEPQASRYSRMMARSRGGSQTSVEVHGVALQHGDQQRAEHAHGVAHRGPGQGGAAAGGLHGPELAHLGADGPVGVDHPLGVGRRPRGVGDDGGRGGRHLPPGRQRPPGRLQLVEVEEPAGQWSCGPDDRHRLDPVEGVAHAPQPVEVVGLPERGRGDEGPHPGATQDVAHLLRPVEVDDGDHGRTQQGRGVEGDGGLRPVGQLERHRVTRSHPALGQRAGQPQRTRPQLAERARPGTRPRVDPELAGPGGWPVPRRPGARGSGRPTGPRPASAARARPAPCGATTVTGRRRRPHGRCRSGPRGSDRRGVEDVDRHRA